MDRIQKTYRIKTSTDCFFCLCQDRCETKNISDDQVFKKLSNGLLYAMIGDGCECYRMQEVEEKI
jgi:hypothetical protein